MEMEIETEINKGNSDPLDIVQDQRDDMVTRPKRSSTRNLRFSDGSTVDVVNLQLNEPKEALGEQSLSVADSGSEDDNEENVTSVNSDKKPRRRLSRDAALRPSKKRCNKFSNIPLSDLKKSGEGFVQDTACPTNNTSSNPRLSKCRECRNFPRDRARKETCRFYAFRKLKYIRAGLIALDGFSDPMADPDQNDLNIWLPSYGDKLMDLDPEMAKFLLYQLGDQFCELVQQELDALRYFEDLRPKKLASEESDGNDGSDKKKEINRIAWRRPVQNAREMCDACETTLFNYHCTCPRCGFAVCVSCFKARGTNSKIHRIIEKQAGRDEFNWLQCSNRRPHELDKMMLSQILPKDVLMSLSSMIHDARENLGIPQYCCIDGRSRVVQNNQLMTKFLNGTWNTGDKNSVNDQPAETSTLPTHPPKKRRYESSGDEEEEDEDAVELSNFLERRKLGQPAVMQSSAEPRNVNPSADQMDTRTSEHEDTKTDISTLNTALNYEAKQINGQYSKLLPILVRSSAESVPKFPGVPHSWLCNGKLLRLYDPTCEGNFGLFQEVWKRGQPVIVSNVSDKLNKALWSPQSFCDDFGELKNDLVNCVTGKLVLKQPMTAFWNGFECISKRLRDEKGNPMLLKLKDWPPGDDFKAILPSRFKDLMNALPLKEYTQRNGRLNLAARLPTQFVPPDLGPKMYIAYGSGTHLDKGTTNLHLDISDAVNLMVYTGIPDEGLEAHNAGVRAAILDSDCDIATLERVTRHKEIPGALWHIYNARDADKIRDLINKVFLERGIPPKPNHDPIHDQCCYLDKELRARLKAQYNVVGYPIIQCMGDAVFIPAGAPHQVRNLQNCIKVAEDFVSPENVSHCFRLTEEFRDLSETHTNHEDKLQIKNIIYHAVKDAVSVVHAQTVKKVEPKEVSTGENRNN